MEKVQLVLRLLHPYTFIPTSTVIREMRVHGIELEDRCESPQTMSTLSEVC